MNNHYENERLDNSLLINDISKRLVTLFPEMTRLISYPASIIIIFLFKRELNDLKTAGKDIVLMLETPPATVYSLLSKMKNAGLIESKSSGLLRNRNHYTITPECKKLLEDI